MEKNIKNYTDLSSLQTFEERYAYLRLGGKVGGDTFGFDRYLNQMFYRSQEWQQVRDYVICRDLGCDLGIAGYEINHGGILIHHMNPISKQDIESRSEILLDPEFLITTILKTHNAIHYGNETAPSNSIVNRTRNDMCPWKK